MLAMKDLLINSDSGENFSPDVNFSLSGRCEISGESYMEDSLDFYKPLLDWLEKYFKEIGKPIDFHIKLTYFNTATSKWLHKMFKMLKNFEKNDGVVNIIWYHIEWDKDMVMEIDDFSKGTELSIRKAALHPD